MSRPLRRFILPLLLRRPRLSMAEADRDKLRAAVLQAQAQADELIAALKSLAADKDAARAAAAAAHSEADRLRRALGDRPSDAAQPPAQRQQVYLATNFKVQHFSFGFGEYGFRVQGRGHLNNGECNGGYRV